jgi:hypothetical protein
MKEEYMNRRRIVFVWSILMVTSCNLPVQPLGTPLASPVAAISSAAFSTPTGLPIETLLARPTSTFVPTSTPRLALASPIAQPVNCRYGPSTAYAVVGGLEVGRQAEIVGKNIDVTWWYVKNPSNPSTLCWLVAELVHAVGRVDSLPVVAAPPAQVTDIKLRADSGTYSLPERYERQGRFQSHLHALELLQKPSAPTAGGFVFVSCLLPRGI